MTKDVMAVTVSAVASEGLIKRSELDLSAYAELLDGLVLQGGADLAPESYGETPLSPDWAGDRIRDRYGIDLFNAFVQVGKPVIGICRGCQLINVALGGTLYQDISTQIGGSEVHADRALYDRVLHDIDFVEGSGLARLYPDRRHTQVNSIHHQAIKDLGKDVIIEAHSARDGIVESIRWDGPSYAFGMQWPTEFLAERQYSDCQMDGSPILNGFLDQARHARS
jgi:putative glutamine amidotransferase